jgi:hypothetical protein
MKFKLKESTGYLVGGIQKSGSGNFGHFGRPGFVGGSSSNKTENNVVKLLNSTILTDVDLKNSAVDNMLSSISKELKIKYNCCEQNIMQKAITSGRLPIWISLNAYRGKRYDTDISSNIIPDSEHWEIDISVGSFGETYHYTQEGPIENYKSYYRYRCMLPKDFSKNDLKEVKNDIKFKINKGIQVFKDISKKLERQYK